MDMFVDIARSTNASVVVVDVFVCYNCVSWSARSWPAAVCEAARVGEQRDEVALCICVVLCTRCNRQHEHIHIHRYIYIYI